MSKATMVDGWKEIALEGVFDFKKGQGLSKEKLNRDGKNPCLLYGELYTTYSEVIEEALSYTDAHEGVPSVVGDVLIPASTTTSALDVATAAAIEQGRVFLGGDINILRKKSGSEIDSRFIAYLLTHEEKRNLARFAQGSTIVHLYGRHIRKLLVRVPSFEQQSQIVAILEDVKRTITGLEDRVEKQEKILDGVLRELFEYGVDENGVIRNEKTHKFKASPLGRVPSEWKVRPLRELLIANPRNGIYKPASEIGTGTLLVGQTSFTRHGTLNYSLARRANISKNELETFSLRKGDILVSRVFATVEGVGRPVLISDLPEEAVYESNMLKLSVDTSLMLPEVLFRCLKSYAVRKKIVAQINSSNQSSINQQALNTLPLAVPDLAEQKRILTAFRTAAENISSSLLVLNKFQRIRLGLIKALLVGTVHPMGGHKN
jgi:type I restriction enzyme, S subunit